jgi:hypothetical protein
LDEGQRRPFRCGLFLRYSDEVLDDAECTRQFGLLRGGA